MTAWEGVFFVVTAEMNAGFDKFRWTKTFLYVIIQTERGLYMESTIEKTLRHIELLERHLDRYNFRGAVAVALMELGVPTKCVGFAFLRRAIDLQHKDPTRTLAKDIYLEIALHYKQNSAEVVEQAIRDAIKMAWRHGSKRAWDWYFSYDGRSIMNKPTNSEFISRIACILEIWQERKK